MFEFADLHKYPLFSPNEIDQLKLIKTVALATGHPVSKLAFISLSNPCLKPGWMTEELFKASLRNCTKCSFGASLEAGLGTDFWGFLDYSVWVSISNNLVEGLANTLSANFWTMICDNIGSSLKKGLWDSLYYYLASCLINDQEKIKVLRPLIEFWSQCLILGF